ncbi:hypothetical protein A0J61_10099 [Choanephora cucurbitarum]|uniref:Uncharacterized protein n=1 Tax=Choanephora cucurbitarum TaxID=101091 RepID=A0A1C7MYG0_9FUNG|nr:hypothetical protein A0J61_10099 [Choanephora cucurbitarum]
MVGLQSTKDITKDTSSTSHSLTKTDSKFNPVTPKDIQASQPASGSQSQLDFQGLPDTQESIPLSQLDSQLAAICELVSREQPTATADTDMLTFNMK